MEVQRMGNLVAMLVEPKKGKRPGVSMMMEIVDRMNINWAE